MCLHIQQRREEYERHIRDLEEELLQREKEQKEMLMMAAEAEEGEEKEGGRERRRSTLLHPSSSPNKFDYSAYHDTAATTFTFPEFAEREVTICLFIFLLKLFLFTCY